MALTASRLQLADKCLYPWVPGVVWPSDEMGEAARLGTAWHWAVAKVVENPCHVTGPGNLLDRALQYAGLPSSWAPRLRRMLPIETGLKHQGWIPEVAVGLGPNKVSELGRMLERAYPKRPGEIVGTADLVQVIDDLVVVRDWKTGRRDYVTPAADNAQLAFFACAFAELHPQVDEVRVELAFVDADGEIDIDAHTYQPFELPEIRERIVRLPSLVADAKPNPGPHCTGLWCPLRAVCPATTEAVAELVAEPQSFPLAVRSLDAITGPKHAAWLLHRVRAVRAAADAVEGFLRQYADAIGGVPVREGAVWAATTVERSDVRGPLGEVYAALALHDDVEVSVPKKELEAALGPARMREVLTELSKQGLVRTSETRQYKINLVHSREQTPAGSDEGRK